MFSKYLAAAIAALIIVVAFAPSAPASGDAVADTAAKKCKKKKGKKKKKCKKKTNSPASSNPGSTLPPPAPLIRATISWPEDGVDVDLHAYDAAGNQSGVVAGNMVQGIPNSFHSNDSQFSGLELETFADNIFVKGGASNRVFSYIICFQGTATVTFTGVDTAGAGTSTTYPGNAMDRIDIGSPPAGASCL